MCLEDGLVKKGREGKGKDGHNFKIITISGMGSKIFDELPSTNLLNIGYPVKQDNPCLETKVYTLFFELSYKSKNFFLCQISSQGLNHLQLSNLRTRRFWIIRLTTREKEFARNLLGRNPGRGQTHALETNMCKECIVPRHLCHQLIVPEPKGISWGKASLHKSSVTTLFEIQHWVTSALH